MTTDDLVQRMVERACVEACAAYGNDWAETPETGAGLHSGHPLLPTREDWRATVRAALLAALEEMRDAWNRPDYAHPDVRIDLLIERLKA